MNTLHRERPRQKLRRHTYQTIRRRRVRRNTGIAGTFGLLAIAVIFAGWRTAPAQHTKAPAPEPRAPANSAHFKLGLDTTAPPSAAATRTAPVKRVPSPRPKTSARFAKHVSPTQVFAFAEGLILSLPYPKSKVTAIAYHQVYAPGSLRLVPAPQVKSLRITGDAPITPEHVRELKIATKTLRQRRMFRSDRSGPPDRAVDVGSKRGTPVRAPVSGRVLQVRPYMLYGQYRDVEIDILPDANPRVRILMFHMDRVVARRGQHVISGVTPIGRVRDIATYFEPQLAEFTHERGNHVHIQIKPLGVE